MLTSLSDQDATAKARVLFSERESRFDGFEVWDGPRVVIRHPPDQSRMTISGSLSSSALNCDVLRNF